VSDQPREFICPACSGALLVETSNDEQVLACPHCQSPVAIPPLDEDGNVDTGERSDELDHARIMQRATLRRALYRSR
jgi:hypothetical protein